LPAPVKNIYQETMMEESISTFNGNTVGESVKVKRKFQRFDRIKKELLSAPIYLCPDHQGAFLLKTGLLNDSYSYLSCP